MAKITTNTPHGQSNDYGGRASHIRLDRLAQTRDVLREGTVVRVIPGSYTVVCEVDGEKECPTLYLPAMMSNMYGVSSCEQPHEGTQVLIYCPPESSYKYILAVLPVVEIGLDMDTEVEDTGRVAAQELDPEPGSNYKSMKSHRDVNEDDDNLDHVQTNGGRPWNVLAGEWVRGNKMGVAMAVMHFHAMMQASDRAKLEMSVFDDLVRLTSGTYEHRSAMGVNRIFDDEGDLSQEMTGSLRAYERLGKDDFEEVLKYKEGANADTVGVDRPEVSPKDRFRMFSGALADLFQLYVRNPYGGEDTADKSADFRASVAYDGHLNLASRTGISIGLKERIPVPHRKLEPWDVDGDFADEVERKPKESFTFDESYRHGRNLQSSEAAAWREKLLYQRFDERSKDFDMPEDGETQPPNEQTDTEGSKQPQLDRYGDCGIDFNDDGTVRIYGGEGEEIFMRGGCIVFSAPGTIEEHIGKSKIVLAGHDVILKAKESVDVSATNKDVRLTSGGLLHLHSINKGMMLTTDSEGLTIDGDSEGEDVNARGIVIGKNGADVGIVGSNVTMVAQEDLRARGNNVVITAVSRITQAAMNVFIEAGGGSALNMGAAACTLVGRAMGLIAGGAMNFFRGSRSLVAQWVDLDTPPPYDNQLPRIKEYHGSYQQSDAWLGDLNESGRAKIRYTYRTPEQYGTTEPSEIEGASAFRVYMSPWQMNPRFDGEWKEEAIEDTYPWPGKGVRDSCFVTYELGGNVDEFGGLSNRSAMSKEGGSFSEKSMDDYTTNE